MQSCYTGFLNSVSMMKTIIRQKKFVVNQCSQILTCELSPEEQKNNKETKCEPVEVFSQAVILKSARPFMKTKI